MRASTAALNLQRVISEPTPFQRFRRIVLPLIAPAIFAGALFSFTMSLDEFVITYFIIGAQITLPIYIYTQIKFGITPAVNAVATILIVGSLGISGLGLRRAPGDQDVCPPCAAWLQQARRARPVGGPLR